MAPPIGFGWGGHGAMKPAGRLRETLPPHSSGVARNARGLGQQKPRLGGRDCP
jgi:hypothetical protein